MNTRGMSDFSIGSRSPDFDIYYAAVNKTDRPDDPCWNERAGRARRCLATELDYLRTASKFTRSAEGSTRRSAVRSPGGFFV